MWLGHCTPLCFQSEVMLVVLLFLYIPISISSLVYLLFCKDWHLLYNFYVYVWAQSNVTLMNLGLNHLTITIKTNVQSVEQCHLGCRIFISNVIHLRLSLRTTGWGIKGLQSMKTSFLGGCHCIVLKDHSYTGSSRLMRISLLRISLLRFFKTITKNLPNAIFMHY